MDILNFSARELREKIVSGELTSREVVEAYFENIEKNEEEVNAFISFDEELALNKADKIDERIRNKEELGLLAGLPIGIKDNIVTKDFITTAGSKMLEGFESPYDATVIEKIEKEDGIIIGKTNLDEFAMGSTGSNSYYSKYGVTKNPRDLTRVPGGSSSGSAAAVAANEAVLALGSDTGGSVRQPASYCGVVGLKPSYGTISRYGLISMSNTLDQIGVLGKDVLDTAYMFNVISGKDEKDLTTLDSNLIDIEKIENDYSIEGMKIAIPKQCALAETDRIVQTELSKAMKFFQDAGAIVEEVDMPIYDYIEETYHIIVSGDIASNLSRYDGIRYGYRAEDYDTLEELYMNTRAEALGEEVKKRILFGTYILSDGRNKEYYEKALKVRRRIIDDFDNLFKEYDLVLSLSSAMVANKIGEIRNKTFASNENKFLMPANLAGLCAISVPAKVEGLPVGIHLMGNRFEEEKIIKAALAYERMD